MSGEKSSGGEHLEATETESGNGSLQRSSRPWSRFAPGPQTRKLGKFVFGDRFGLVLWLGLVLSLALVWRIGFFITDTYTVANTLVNVADGHLAIRNVEYSLTIGTQPGLHQYDGVLYGRNYGQAFFALPFLWVLEGIAVVAEPRFVLLGGWALGLVAFTGQLGTIATAGSPIGVDGRTVTITGSVVAIGAMIVGVAVGTPLDDGQLALVALQLSTLVAAAFVGVFTYRLLATFEGTRVGIAAGLAAGLATPIGFWASLPKRHVLVAALLMGAIFCFARSRQTGSLRLRAIAYVFAGLIAWIHAFEGFFLVAVLGSVDLATARSNGWRELAVVALALSFALAPTLATNAAIADNPLKSPRLLPSVGVGGVELAPGGDLVASDGTGGIRTSGGGDTLLGNGGGSEASNGGTEGGGGGGEGEAGSGDASSGSTGGSQESGPVGWLVGLFAGIGGGILGLLIGIGSGFLGLIASIGGRLLGLLPRPPDAVLVIVGFVLSTVTEGLASLSHPDQLWHVFVRSGRIPGLRYAINQYEVIDLTMLESMPLLGAFAALPVVTYHRLRRRGRATLRWPRNFSPARQTDLLVVTTAVVFTVIYLSRLPTHSMLTVRYVLPVFVLGLYGLVRLPPVSGSIRACSRTLAGTYGVTVIAGGLSVVGLLRLLDPALGEAVQFHGLLNLTAATALAVVVLGRTTLPDRISTRWVARGLGVAAGVTTIYLALAGMAYFPYGSYAFDVVSVVADLLAWLA